MRKILLLSAGLVTLALGGAAVAATAIPDCSKAKRSCLQLGDTADTCDTRWKACMQSGCWVAGLVKRCGYAKH